MTLRRRAALTCFALLLPLAAGAWDAVALLERRRVLERIAAGDLLSRTFAQADSADVAVRLATTVMVVGVALAAVPFLLWLHAAAGAGRLRSSSRAGWSATIWCWFVPGACLVQPPRVLRALVRSSAATPDGARRAHGLIALWWTLWLGTAALGAAGLAGGADTTPAGLAIRDGALASACAFLCACAILAIAVVQRVTGLLESGGRGNSSAAEPAGGAVA